jgi:hypothetical protein
MEIDIENLQSLLEHFLDRVQQTAEIAFSKRPTKKPEKDGWDKFSAVSSFISGLLVAAVGGYFTFSYNAAQSSRDQAVRINRTVLQRFRPLGSSSLPAEK